MAFGVYPLPGLHPQLCSGAGLLGPSAAGGPHSQAEAADSPVGQAQAPCPLLQEGSPPLVRTAKSTSVPLPACLLTVSGGENSGSLSPHPSLAYALIGQRLPAARKKPRPGLPGPAPQHMVVTCAHSVVANSVRPQGLQPPGSSVHGILQAGILEWVAMPSSGGSS